MSFSFLNIWTVVVFLQCVKVPFWPWTLLIGKPVISKESYSAKEEWTLLSNAQIWQLIREEIRKEEAEQYKKFSKKNIKNIEKRSKIIVGPLVLALSSIIQFFSSKNLITKKHTAKSDFWRMEINKILICNQTAFLLAQVKHLYQ